MLKIFGAITMCGVLIAAYMELQSDGMSMQQTVRALEYDVRILRDSYGVPHIFGKTDAAAAFGVAYAHAEDDFQTLQKTLLATRGLLASVFGRDVVKIDYFMHLLRIWDVVEAKYETDLSAATRAVCEAYAAGLNYYAELHPKERLLAELFPISGKDIVAGFMLKLPVFFGLDDTIRKLFEADGLEMERQIANYLALPVDQKTALGSNAFAVSPVRAQDGKTLLAINSHQPWEGPLAWYEVHVHSEEGWDTVGGIFPGTPVVLVGHNRHLGWGHTVNKPDLIDVYRLELHPDDPNKYRFEGAWHELDVRPIDLKVKLMGPFSWTFERQVLWSVHGPVVRTSHGTYAVRYAGQDEIRQVEQWYRMNKARNLDEWLAAMNLRAIPTFNCVYADREGNILYLYNASIPERDPVYDWAGHLPGHTARTLWDRYVAFDRLPQLLNPPSGFVQSCNNAPFHTTIGDANPAKADFPQTFGLENRMTNRAFRALELFGADDAISEDEFIAYKYDMAYSDRSRVADCVRRILAAPAPEDTLARQAVEVLRGWDLSTTPDNRGAALAVMALRPFVEKKKAFDMDSVTVALARTAKKLKTVHGRIDVPWHQVNRLIRGDLDLGLGGGPDVLHAVYGQPIPGARLKGVAGDSYILLVSWDANGQVTSQSVHQFGSATLDQSSPHYADQAPLFVQRKLKPVWMDEADILEHLERSYRPGEELLN